MISRFPGPYIPINQATPLDGDSLVVKQFPNFLSVSRGDFTGLSVVKRFGRYDSIGTSFTPVCGLGLYNTPEAASATTLRIKAGGDANDTAAGSGAQEVTLVGLDENWNEVSEAVATAGASASSATTTTFTRLYEAYVSASGTYATTAGNSHAATITIENGAGGTDWAEIDSTDFDLGQAEIGAYTIPTGYTGYVFLDDVAIETNGKTVDILFFSRAGADDSSSPYPAMRTESVIYGLTQGINSLEGRSIPFGPFVGPCDIGFLAKVDTTTGGVSCEFDIHLVNE